MIRWLQELLEDALDAAPRKQRQRQQDAARIREERLAEEQIRKKKDDQHFGERLTRAEVSRRAHEKFLRDLGDATIVAGRAYDRAVKDEEGAREALEDARRNALVLPDGRRVYFALDGRLYGDDGGEITNPAELRAARAARDLKPDATSYENYREKVQKADETRERLDRISQTLQRLGDLKERLQAGDATPDELSAARKELDGITQSMSPDIRAEYDHLRSARTGEASLDAPIPSAPTILASDFARANQTLTAREGQSSGKPEPTSTPAYKAAPDF